MICKIRSSFTLLILGFVLGFYITNTVMVSTLYNHEWLSHTKPWRESVNKLIDKAEFKNHSVISDHSEDDVSIAEKLYSETRVLCMIMTNSINQIKRARHIKLTWGKRCNKLLFFSNTSDSTLGTIDLNIEEVQNSKLLKTIAAFRYVYENHFNDADWFFKADDTTYTVVENLRYLLYPYSPETPIYFGSKFKPAVKQNYASEYSGAGYVLSHEALRRFAEKSLHFKTIYSESAEANEDIEIGRCLANVQVEAGSSIDSKGRERFFSFPPEIQIWNWKHLFYEEDMSLDVISNYAITFHQISPNQMYELHYFIYHVRPYGIVFMSRPLPERKPIL